MKSKEARMLVRGEEEKARTETQLPTRISSSVSKDIAPLDGSPAMILETCIDFDKSGVV